MKYWELLAVIGVALVIREVQNRVFAAWLRRKGIK